MQYLKGPFIKIKINDDVYININSWLENQGSKKEAGFLSWNMLNSCQWKSWEEIVNIYDENSSNAQNAKLPPIILLGINVKINIF